MKITALVLLTSLALGPAAAQATDISGVWQVSTSIAQAPVVLDCSILQVGVRLTGWCEPETADARPVALTGALDRTQATWGYDIDVQGQPIHLAYQGTLNADSLGMTGALSYGGGVAAGLTAIRK